MVWSSSVLPVKCALVRGAMMQGQHIVLICEEKNWASPGVLYVWGCVLDRFPGLLRCHQLLYSL